MNAILSSRLKTRKSHNYFEMKEIFPMFDLAAQTNYFQPWVFVFFSFFVCLPVIVFFFLFFVFVFVFFIICYIWYTIMICFHRNSSKFSSYHTLYQQEQTMCEWYLEIFFLFSNVQTSALWACSIMQEMIDGKEITT